MGPEHPGMDYEARGHFRRGFLAAGVAITGLALAPRALSTGTPSLDDLPDRAAWRQAATPAADVLADWQDFARRFVTAEGRVVDSANGGISHSEGQGAGLLFALRADDQARFAKILAWTRGTLRRPHDSLLAWRYRPGAPAPVSDRNNATDGDLLVAWALADAAERWGVPEYRAQAATMARDLLRHAVIGFGGETVLLPGVEGFQKPDHLIVNPSYYVLPAFRALGRLVRAPEWRGLTAHGVALAETARFGRWGLPADWVALPRAGGRPALAPGWPPRFSYDALRVPLNLAWGGHVQGAAVRSAAAFWTAPSHRVMPAWVDLRTGHAAPYPADTGQRAIARLLVAAMRGTAGTEPMPRAADARHYYHAVLAMMSRLALHDLDLAPRDDGHGLMVAAQGESRGTAAAAPPRR
jgi:endoglucanase